MALRYCSAADLAGAGVAIGAYNLVARCFNFLSSAVTSQIAAAADDALPGRFNADMSRNAAAALAVTESARARVHSPSRQCLLQFLQCQAVCHSLCIVASYTRSPCFSRWRASPARSSRSG